MIRQFKLHWKDGTTNIVKGEDIAASMNNAGFGGGSIGALDYHEEIPQKQPMPLNTLDYRNAPGNIGPEAFNWRDKPHRLIYDLCAEIERLRSQRYDPDTHTLQDLNLI